MNEDQRTQPGQEIDESQLDDLSLIFAPSWARQSPEDIARQTTRFARSVQDDTGSAQRRSSDRDRAAGYQTRRLDADRGQPHGERRPSRRAEGFSDRRSPPPRRMEREDDTQQPPFRRSPPQTAALPPLAIDVRFQPEQKALGAIIQRIKTTNRAYPIREIIRLFHNSDESVLVRLEGLKDGSGPAELYQCRVCGMPSLTADEVRNHLMLRHMSDFFDIEEVEGEAPAGNFPCVARCGLSGEWLGPPNHHSFAARVQELLRERFPGMPEEEYRRRIEMVRDPEAIEAWRSSSRGRTLYRRKPSAETSVSEKPQPAGDEAAPDVPQPADDQAAQGAPSAAEAPPTPAMERQAAELLFNREILPQQVGCAKHLVCPATALKQLPDRRLATLLNNRIEEEGRRHGSLFHAVRGAFRHRGLHMFRANDERGPEFVMGMAPVALDTTHAVTRLREIVGFITENPCCTQATLTETLASTADAAARAEIATQVKWLLEKHHLVEYFNGMLTIPGEFPVFHLHPKKPKTKKPQAAAGADAPAAVADEDKTPGAPVAQDEPAAPATAEPAASSADETPAAPADLAATAAATPPDNAPSVAEAAPTTDVAPPQEDVPPA